MKRVFKIAALVVGCCAVAVLMYFSSEDVQAKLIAAAIAGIVIRWFAVWRAKPKRPRETEWHD